MSESKFTPGPWRLDAEGEGNDHVIAGDYHCISAGHGYFTDERTGFGISAFMSQSDAKLITAAPDLLEALISIESGSGTSPAAKKKFAKARAAIAKATA